MARSNKQRRDRHIYEFITKKMNEKVGNQQKYKYGAVMAMAEQRFYLSQATLAEIYRNYVPDPDQLGLDFPADQPQPTS